MVSWEWILGAAIVSFILGHKLGAKDVATVLRMNKEWEVTCQRALEVTRELFAKLYGRSPTVTEEEQWRRQAN